MGEVWVGLELWDLMSRENQKRRRKKDMEKENEVIGRSQKPQRQEVEREGEREGAETELARHE